MSRPITTIFSVSCDMRLTTFSPLLLVYPHLGQTRVTFFSFFDGRRVEPHFGQNCKTAQLLPVAARGVLILYREKGLDDIELTNRWAIRTGSGKSSMVQDRWITCLIVSGLSC